MTRQHEQHTIEQDAYAGISLQFQPAPLFKRIFAHCIDLGIVGALSYAFLVTFGIMIGVTAAKIDKLSDSMKDASNPYFWLLMGLILLLMLSYLLFIHTYFIYNEYKKGYTPGKKFMGLQVLSTDGARLTLRQCINRELLRYIDALIIPGLLAVLLTEKRQRLGDLFAGTVVTHSVSLESSQEYLYLKREDFLLVQSHITLETCSPEEAEQCLRMAYRCFIQKSPVHDDEIQPWEDFADRKVTSSTDFPLHPRDKFLFLAEYFRQQTKENNS